MSQRQPAGNPSQAIFKNGWNFINQVRDIFKNKVIVGLKQRQVLFLISLAFIAATLVAYEPMRHNDFVNYDDTAYVTENPYVTSGFTFRAVIYAFTKTHGLNWHPLTTLSHILDCQLFGVNPLGHHIVSLLFHIASALLLFWLLADVTGSTWASVFVAGVFALHPIQVESVAWVAERKTVVSGLFWLLTMLSYVRYARRPSKGRYILLILIYGLSIMTKPVVVTLPFVLLLMDYWPLERFGKHPQAGLPGQRIAGTGGAKHLQARRLLIEKVPLFVLSAVLCVVTYSIQTIAVMTLERSPLDSRIANMFLSYISYTGKVFWPDGLAAIYPLRQVNFSDAAVILCALVFVIITIISIYIGRRRRYAAVGWLWFAGTLVPMIGLVQAGSQGMADRYMYLSILGLLIVVAWSVKDLVINYPRLKVFAVVLSVVVLLVLVVLTRMQVRHWQNGLTLFENALKVTGTNEIAEFGYGNALLDAGRLDESVVHLSNSIRLCPSFPKSRRVLGKVYIKQGKFNEAIICFNELIRRKQDTVGIYEDLGTAYAQLGKYEQAIESWTKAVELKTYNAMVLNNLAWLLATEGQVTNQNAARAVELAENACKLTSYKKPEFLDTLAAAYAEAGRFEDAVKTAQKGIEAAEAASKKETAGEIQKRLELYKAGERYRQRQKTEDR